MKKFIALCIFAIGMFVLWPPGEQAKAANSDQVIFEVDHHFVVPVAAAIDNYTLSVIENEKAENVIFENSLACREGGGVEVQVFNLVTQPTYLIENKMKAHNFTEYSNLSIRSCVTYKALKNKNIPNYNVFVHRFARDGLTCS